MRRFCTGLLVCLSLPIICILLSPNPPPAALVHSYTLHPLGIVSYVVKSKTLRRVLPSYIEHDLRILQDVCSADVFKVDIVRRELLLTNFTVCSSSACTRSTSTDNPRPSLRVGFANVSWESYIRPCVRVEMSDVDVLVEFTNLLLSRTNWHELRDEGFPPALLVGYASADGDELRPVEEQKDDEKLAISTNIDEVGRTPTRSTVTSSFVRIKGLELSGNVTLRVTSRPLGGEDIVPPFSFGLDALDDLSEQIQREADVAAERGRRGCSTDRAYDIVVKYFLRKLQQILASTAFDISLLGKDATSIQKLQRIKSTAEGLVKNYAASVTEVAEEKTRNRLGGVQRKVLDILRAAGLDDDQVEAARLGSESIAKQTAGLLKSAFSDRLQYSNRNGGQTDDKGDISENDAEL
mmetsp:Transcript_29958/g.66370  ORF Transcript_29958/g.66370 Transcript_29958/m.66370 type:complete len:409 (+) Transcript_29958:138-1364(+)